MFLSPRHRSSLGSTNVSPRPHWCLTEPPPPPPGSRRAAGPDMRRETQQRRSSCPVGMEVITDNIISSCAPTSPQHFASELEESVRPPARPPAPSLLPSPIHFFPSSSPSLFNLLHSCSHTNNMQIPLPQYIIHALSV